MSQLFEITPSDQGDILLLSDAWRMPVSGKLSEIVDRIEAKTESLKVVDASQVLELDAAGALLLNLIFERLQKRFPELKIIGFNESVAYIYHAIQDDLKKISQNAPQQSSKPLIERIGQKTVQSVFHIGSFFAFLGEVFVCFFRSLLSPSRIRWRSIVAEIDTSGYRALPIIGVMAFLIGVVLAYQLGSELAFYGANIYIVELTGVAVLREFSPLISSVIIAGRTATAFAALLGTMKVNEEVDALKTMGISPIGSLVLPKMIALAIALPLLVVWGDLFGVCGAMMMSKSMLGIGYKSFIVRFQQKVALKHLVLGLIKAPVFAFIIAGIGCFQGFQAAGSAQSVGLHTTKAAVQAIFLIIVADALFSILFSWMGL